MTTCNIEKIIYLLDHNSGKDNDNPIIIDSDSEEENSLENPIIIDIDDEDMESREDNQNNDKTSEKDYDSDDELFSNFKTYETKKEMLSDIK